MIINNKILNVEDCYYGMFMTILESLTRFSTNELQSAGLAEIYYKHILCNNDKLLNRPIDYDTLKLHYEITEFEIGVSENSTALSVG